ncbi:MAG: serpin family protein [Chloroflexi bacterium]|nr:serpin family protein [Chloroflexota bacterium]
MHSPWLSILLLLAVLALCGCSALPNGPAHAAEVAQSANPRQAAPELPPAEIQTLAETNGSFAFALYGALRERKGNLFASPYSISQALAMTYAGARGQTAQQMADALRLILAPERLHPAWNSLDQTLTNRNRWKDAVADGPRFMLHIVNALWGQADYEFRPEYLDLLAEHYGAGMRLLDFSADPAGARETINRWVGEQTQGKISDLLPSGTIDPLTRLVLTNAIYFDAAWQYPFLAEATQDGPFTHLDGSTVQARMMRQSKRLPYAEGPTFQAVELPYVGGELSMVVVLPAPGQFQPFEESLDWAQWQEIAQALDERDVELTLPKWDFDSQFNLSAALQRLGMTDAFNVDAADFSGMDGTDRLYIKEVIHKAAVTVDEAGTVAAAATAVILVQKAMPLEPVTFTADRPFVFLIRDRGTGSILFLGRVLDPTL